MNDQTSRPASKLGLGSSWVALTGLSAVFLFEMLDNSILNVALPTLSRDLHASSALLPWVTGAYSATFGVLMLPFGVLADRFGRRRVLLIGLTLLGLASLATAFVTTVEQLVAVRALMGVAAAMTAPGSMALAFRLFDEDRLRVKAITLLSTVGLVGLAVGPTIGGLVLAVAPWQVLLLVNVPVAILALAGIHRGIPVDGPRAPAEPPSEGLWPLVTRPLVSSGLAFKAAAGLATAGLGYLVTLRLQLDWGWPPALAALGMLPQVIVLLAGGTFVSPFVDRVGLGRAAWMSAAAVVVGLAVYAGLGTFGYPWVALALMLVAAGLRVIGVVAATNVLKGLPESRTTLGAALTDTVTQLASAAGLAVAGTPVSALGLTGVAALLVTGGFLRSTGRASGTPLP
jgi:MFS family permease